MLMKPAAVAEFDGHILNITDMNGTAWLRGNQIGSALGLAFPIKAVTKVYRRHKMEFGPDETSVIELETAGGKQLTRLFSPRGAARLAMLVNSPRAAAFRSWVLDTLEERAAIPPAALPAPASIPLELLRPDLAAVLRYRRLGLTQQEMGRLLDLSVHQVNRRCMALRQAGLLSTGA